MIRTGIFGGSFNPIHNGHIALARQLRDMADLNEVWLMVSPQNPLKQQEDLLDDPLRLEMARQALEGEKGILASDYEFHLPRPSYTWNTLQHLSHDYPDRKFLLLIGGDNWARFDHWRRWKDILRQYEVVVYPRDNHPGTIQADLLPISSTDIRQRVQSGRNIQGLVPDSIVKQVTEYYR
jgi:nicotinate-nucleotide adenylyltransferase